MHSVVAVSVPEQEPVVADKEQYNSQFFVVLLSAILLIVHCEARSNLSQ
jgi:hypothetical protein